MSSENNVKENPDSTSSSNTTGTQRRVGRVERWLRKGFGFITDMGRLEQTDTYYGWVKDKLSGEKVFVYHNALKSNTENVFHRLFANEYVEFTIDLGRSRRDERFQAFDVTGINGSELLCDLNAAAAEAENYEGGPTPKNTPVTKTRRSYTRRSQFSDYTAQQPQPSLIGFGGAPPPGATVQYIYYVPQPTSGSVGGEPQPFVQGFPPSAATTHAEPSYVMPASGIPVPK